MDMVVVVEQSYEYSIVVNETHGHEWLWESMVTNCVVVDAKQLVYIYFGLLDFLLCPRLPTNHPDKELTVVIVANSKFLDIWRLFYFFTLDVLLRLTSNLLLAQQCVLLKAVLLDVKFIFILFCNCDYDCGVIRNSQSHDWIHGEHIRGPQ